MSQAIRMECYARANHGCSKADLKPSPTHHMGEFMTWLSRHWTEWYAANWQRNPYMKTEQDQSDFTAWLCTRYKVRRRAVAISRDPAPAELPQPRARAVVARRPR